MKYQKQTANEITRRTEKMINALWNSTDPVTRFSMRRAFFGVKPSVVDFLVNAALMVYRTQKDPEA